MPDILIGNVRGPQGETGPANTLLASVYQFCASDTGATIPQDGAWTSGVPQIEKGKYIWCRNTLTWDSGPETVLYSVGYVGYDGEFNGIELVNELGQRVDALEDRVTPISKGGTESTTLEGAKAKLGITALVEALEKVNDYTTGINLISGSRDFREGLNKWGNTKYTTDGFVSENPHTAFYDREGYRCLKFENRSSGEYTLNTIVDIPAKTNDTFTLSYDFMFEDKTGLTNTSQMAYIYVYSIDNTPIHTTTVSLANLGLDASGIQTNKWYTGKYVYTLPRDIDGESNGILFRISTRPNTVVNYKKPMLQTGTINHPIYAPNPNDVDFINDETTGINLVYGTRDFSAGKTLVPNIAIFKDGFSGIDGTIAKVDTSDGFGVLNITRTTADTSFRDVVSSAVMPIKKGDKFTASIEVKVDDVSALTQAVRNIFIVQTFNSSGTSSELWYPIDASTESKIVSGEWVKIVFPFTVTKDDGYLIRCLCRVYGRGSVNFRKLCVYKGHVNNPVWSASPFDVASSKVQTSFNASIADTGIVTLAPGIKYQKIGRMIELRFAMTGTDHPSDITWPIGGTAQKVGTLPFRKNETTHAVIGSNSNNAVGLAYVDGAGQIYVKMYSTDYGGIVGSMMMFVIDGAITPAS